MVILMNQNEKTKAAALQDKDDAKRYAKEFRTIAWLLPLNCLYRMMRQRRTVVEAPSRSVGQMFVRNIQNQPL
ncbi:hypothetical protein Q1695_002075 [Nippostrongylus brasiliensis]|nr:hypothetical protein Q1695_002075 [Nippostrongylus brasiliensis]